MIGKNLNESYTEILDGIKIKTLVYGNDTLMTEFILKKGSLLPEHKLPYEQIGYLVSGKIKLKIDDAINEINPGDSWCILKNKSHGAEIMDDSIALEIFHPAREDYKNF